MELQITIESLTIIWRQKKNKWMRTKREKRNFHQFMCYFYLNRVNAIKLFQYNFFFKLSRTEYWAYYFHEAEFTWNNIHTFSLFDISYFQSPYIFFLQSYTRWTIRVVVNKINSIIWIVSMLSLGSFNAIWQNHSEDPWPFDYHTMMTHSIDD